MVQDKKGYLWFGTLNGLSRFDGTRFINYKAKDGLNSNSITYIVEGEDNTLYLSNFERGINTIKDGKIENFIEDFDGKYFSIAYMIEYQKQLFAYSPLLDIHVINKNKVHKDFAQSFNTNPERVKKLIILPDHKLAALTLTGLFYLNNYKLTKIPIKNLDGFNFTSYAKDKDGSFLIGSSKGIYRIKNNEVIKKYGINLPGNILIENIFIDSNRNIWFNVSGKGFYIIYHGSNEIINLGAKLKLDITHITNFLEDKEGNIWISTFGKGVYCLNNLYLKNYSEFDGLNNNNINKIAKDNHGRIILGTYKGINILEKNNLFKLNGNSEEEYIGDINTIVVHKNDVFVAWSRTQQNAKPTKHKEQQFKFTTKRSLLKTSSGVFVYGGWGNEIRISKNFEQTPKTPTNNIFFNAPKSNRIYDLKEDSQKNIWIASALGLARISNLTQKDSIWSFDKTFFQDNQLLNSRINFVHEDSKKTMWFAGSKGVASYHLDSKKITNYETVQGFDMSSANSIASDSKNRIWIGTLSGLYVLEGDTIKLLNSKTGLPADEILSLFYDKEEDDLYIGTSNGLSIMDVKLFDNFQYPELSVKVNTLKSGETIYADDTNLRFEPTQNNLYIDFSVLLYSSPEIIKYRYKLNHQLLETNNNFLNLVSLKDGKYELEITAKTQNTSWGKPLLIKFEVLPYFYETFWFFSIMVFLFAVSIILFARRRITINAKKSTEQIELNERINQLKHEALSSMMNPHFIFNSLNSVQYLVNTKRNEEANNYIAIMAKLIRKNLDMAQSRFILLAEEINRLKLYLNLEKLRLQEGFSYEFIISNEVDIQHTMIPNMIIQPFVENTLWHGIVKSGNEGLVSISFSFENVEIDEKICKSLIIKITDNGIGIIEAKKHKNQDHVSKGIDIIMERLRLLSEKMELPQPIMIDDLASKNKNLHGTEVVISLPLPLYKIIE